MERKVTKHNKTRGWVVNFTTHGSSVVKITCIFRWTRVPSVFCACAALAKQRPKVVAYSEEY